MILVGVYALALLLGAGATYFGLRIAVPGQSVQTANASPLQAGNVISGTVFWKDTDKPAGNVRVVASDAESKEVVAEAKTDDEGAYMMTVGVGTWLVDIPTGDGYFGYGQLVTVLPHESYKLDFGVTVRPPDPPTPTAQPTNTAGAVQTPLPGATLTPRSAAAASATAIAAATVITGGVTLPQSGAGPGATANPVAPLFFLSLLFLLAGLCGNVLYLRGAKAAREEQS